MTHFATNLTKRASLPVASRFRYIDPSTDQEFVGEAEISEHGFNEEYEGYKTYQEATILNLWLIDGLANATKVDFFDFERWFQVHLEAAAIEQHNNQTGDYIGLPTDWEIVKVNAITCVLNVETAHPLPTGAPLIGSKLESVTPLHMPGKNAYVISSLLPPSDAVAEVMRLAKLVHATFS